MRKIMKVGKNRGNDRIWIEGRALLEHNKPRGSRFTRYVSDDCITLSFDAGDFKSGPMHTVAGGDQRPIIDLNGGWVTDFFKGATHYEVTFTPGFYIIIRGIHKNA